MLGRRAVTLPWCPVTWALGKQNLGQFICPMLPDGAREFPHGLSCGLPGSPGFQKLHLSLTSLTPPTPHFLRLQQEPPSPERHWAQLWEETFCVFLCNKIECVCVCRCSVFLQTPLLGCYEIKTIFSLSKCFPSKPLEAHNSQPIFNSHFLGDRRKWQFRVLFPPKRPPLAWNKRPARGGSVSMTALINVSFTLNFSNDR